MDDSLLGQEWSRAYAYQFQLAVAEWNRADGTNREREEIPEQLGDTDKQKESGSQPSPMETVDTETADT